MTLKLKALDNIAMSTVMMASERQLRGQNMYDISIDMTGNNGRNVNGGGDDDGDAFSPPSPESCMSQSTTSATLVALTISAANSASTDTVKSSNSNTIMQESGTFENEEEYNAPLFMCWLPDWETFKSGAIHKNSLQLVAFTIFEWCMVSYSGLQIWQHDQLFKGIGVPMDVMIELGDSNTRMILFSQLGVQVTACLGITLLTWRLYSEFGWLVFQKLGADVSLRKMMKEYRLLFTLLKLDAFFFFGYAIQVAALTDKQWQKGLIEVAFAIPLSAIIILLGFCALRNENKVTMGGFITCLTLLIGYMIFRLSALYQTLTGDPSSDPYFFSRRTMTVFAALTLFITILAFINAIVMLYNFNKGLKEAMRQYRVRRSGTIRSVTPSLNRISVNGSGSISGEILGPGSRPVSGGVAGNKGTGRNSKRTSKRSLLHRDMSSSTPVMAERWQIE
ncbi:hypothetical protein BGX27_005670 [Mortierella sp. AM989]|nr:hypothetical protein BGX27_005670 [Mortierella sp. AM989]